MAIKEYETLARDMDERYEQQMKAMAQSCTDHMKANIELCNEQLAARDVEIKKTALGFFVSGIFVGVIIAVVLMMP